MTDRDEELARRLAELETPEHGPGFWSDLRAVNPTPFGAGPERHFVENGGAADSTSSGPGAERHFVENEEPVLLDERRSRRASRAWLAAAAVVVLALVGAGVLLGPDEGVDVATDPTETDDDVATTPAGPLRPEGDPVERGRGRVVAVDPAGEFLYVADEWPDGGFGCEGSPRQALFVEPIDGGERRPVLPPELADASGGIDVVFGPEGEIAVHSYCEGFTASLVTGTVGDDGSVAEPVELTIPDLDLGRPVDWLADLEFRTTDLLVATTYSRGEDGSEHRHLYELPTGPSEVSDLGEDGLLHLDVTADGRLATASTEGTVRFDGEVVAELPEVRGLSVSPSGQRIAVAVGDLDALEPEGAPRELVLVDTATSQVTRVAEPAAAVEMPTDDVVLFSVGEGGGHEIWSIDVSMPVRATPLSRAIGSKGFVITPDLSRLFTTGVDPTTPAVLEQRLTR